jgi:hypothetical protein
VIAAAKTGIANIIKKSIELPKLIMESGGYKVQPTPLPVILSKPIPNKKKIKDIFNNQ